MGGGTLDQCSTVELGMVEPGGSGGYDGSKEEDERLRHNQADGEPEGNGRDSDNPGGGTRVLRVGHHGTGKERQQSESDKWVCCEAPEHAEMRYSLHRGRTHRSGS